MIPTRKVLVVDDDLHTNNMISETLKIEEFEVLSAKTGEEALEIVNREKNIDLILLDLILPGIKGWALADELKKDPQTASIPIMVVSVLSPEDTQIAQSHPHILGYICKPFDISYLVKEIKKAFFPTQ